MTLARAFFPTLAAAGILLGACGRKAPVSAQTSTPTPEPVNPLATRIGFFAPMSGPQASFGNDAINGAQLAVQQINAEGGVLGHPLRLIAKDTQSRADETGTVVAELINEDQVAALVGEIASERSLVAAPVAQARGVPMISPGSTSAKVTAAGDHIFRMCFTDDFQASSMAKFARSLGVEKAAIFFDPANPYGSGLAEAFKRDFTAHGGTIPAEELYHAGDRDFTVQLNAIKAKMPEVVFLPSYYAEAALIIRQARELGLDMPFLGTDGWDSAEFLKIGGEAVNNCYFSSHFTLDNRAANVAAFVEAYAEKYGRPPAPLAALAYDTIYLLADALKRSGTTDHAALTESLAATKDFHGVTGPISFDASRNPAKPVIVLRVDSGKFTYLETAEPPARPKPQPSPPASATASPSPAAAPLASPSSTPAPSPTPAP